MKYLVMENHESHSIVLDEAGAFHRVANLGYEIGETVTDPIFMKTPEKQKKLNWKKVSTIAAIFMCMLLASVPFINNHNQADILVYMSINPEIHLELNEAGEIIKIVADNEDGKTLLDGYKFRGKSVESVLIELIDRAERLEFLSKGGNVRITVESSNEGKAHRISFNLSEKLKNKFVKRYLIKIRVNNEEYLDLDDVINHVKKEPASETESVTDEPTSEQYQHSFEYTHDNNSDSTKPASNDSTESGADISKPTESTQPVTDPTKPSINNPTDNTEPTENPTEPAAPTDPTTGEDDDDDDNDDDWVWPWWPANAEE